MILWRNFRDRATVIVLCCLLMMHGQANCGSSFFSWSFCHCKCSISSLVFIINNLKKSSSEGGKGLFVSEGTQLKSSRPDAAALLKSPPGCRSLFEPWYFITWIAGSFPSNSSSFARKLKKDCAFWENTEQLFWELTAIWVSEIFPCGTR